MIPAAQPTTMAFTMLAQLRGLNAKETEMAAIQFTKNGRDSADLVFDVSNTFPRNQSPLYLYPSAFSKTPFPLGISNSQLPGKRDLDEEKRREVESHSPDPLHIKRTSLVPRSPATSAE